MKHRRPVADKETLNHIQRGRAQLLEYAEPETLSDRRVDAIEDCVRPRAFYPLGPAAGEQTTPCFRELNARVPLVLGETNLPELRAFFRVDD